MGCCAAALACACSSIAGRRALSGGAAALACACSIAVGASGGLRCCLACTCGVAGWRCRHCLRMSILARNGMGKMSIMLRLVVVLMTSCVGKGIRENPYPATLRSATCVGKGGSATSQRIPTPRNATYTGKGGSANTPLATFGASKRQRL